MWVGKFRPRKEKSMDYGYSFRDVLSLCGINVPSGDSVRIMCPFCQKNKINRDFKIDFRTGSWGCFRCGITSRYAVPFYAHYYNMSTKEAHKEIMERLNLSSTSNNKHIVPRTPRKMTEANVVVDTEIASIEVRDQTYKTMLEFMSLSDKNLQDLLSRGFEPYELTQLQYVTYPKKNDNSYTPEYFDIPNKLLDKSCTLKGIPGFFRTKNKGVWSLCSRKGGVLVPYRDYHNRIQGFQLRKNNDELIVDEETGEKENKYSWISSNGLVDGCKIDTTIHYATDFKWDKEAQKFFPVIPNHKILLTEGAMKGDLTHAITGMPLICIPGVSTAITALEENIPLLKASGVDTIILAYDMDRIMNIKVLLALQKMKDFILSQGMNYNEASWSNVYISLQGEKKTMHVPSSFVFSSEKFSIPETEREKINLEKDLQQLKELNRHVYFAIASSKDATKENREKFLYLCERCKAAGLSLDCILWSLKLKGIDDYYAHQKRNVKYV